MPRVFAIGYKLPIADKRRYFLPGCARVYLRGLIGPSSVLASIYIYNRGRLSNILSYPCAMPPANSAPIVRNISSIVFHCNTLSLLLKSLRSCHDSTTLTLDCERLYSVWFEIFPEFSDQVWENEVFIREIEKWRVTTSSIIWLNNIIDSVTMWGELWLCTKYVFDEILLQFLSGSLT